MSPRQLLISDLHLEDERPDITNTLLQFLQDNRSKCEALYILGDLFEVWIGDDEDSDLGIKVADALAQFAEAVRKRMHPRDVAGRFDGTALMVLLERGSAVQSKN